MRLLNVFSGTQGHSHTKTHSPCPHRAGDHGHCFDRQHKSSLGADISPTYLDALWYRQGSGSPNSKFALSDTSSKTPAIHSRVVTRICASIILVATVLASPLTGRVFAQKTEADNALHPQFKQISPGHKGGTAKIAPPGQSDSRYAENLFLSTVLSLRTIAILEPQLARPNYEKMPITQLGKDSTFQEQRPLFWSFFFRDSIVRIAMITSSTPLALYYNPLMDVVVKTTWTRVGTQRYELVEMQALPGEFVDGESAMRSATVAPYWLISQQKGLEETLRQMTQMRLEGLAKRYPVMGETGHALREAGKPQEVRSWQELAEQRMLLHVVQLRSMGRPSLKGMVQSLLTNLRGIEGTSVELFSHGQGAEVKVALEKLDAQVRHQIELSGLYLSEKGQALALFSLPQDGHIYIFVQLETGKEDGYLVKGLRLISLRSSNSM